ncbi:hypothetical protein Tco_0849099 [Tanacetum coccineum]
MKTDMVKHEVEIETLGECVDEIDKLAELIGEMQLKQEDRSCVHASNELHLHVFHVVAGRVCKKLGVNLNCSQWHIVMFISLSNQSELK